MVSVTGGMQEGDEGNDTSLVDRARRRGHKQHAVDELVTMTIVGHPLEIVVREHGAFANPGGRPHRINAA